MKEEKTTNLVIRVESDLLYRFRIICVKKRWTQAQVIREYIEAMCDQYEREDKKNAMSSI